MTDLASAGETRAVDHRQCPILAVLLSVACVDSATVGGSPGADASTGEDATTSGNPDASSTGEASDDAGDTTTGGNDTTTGDQVGTDTGLMECDYDGFLAELVEQFEGVPADCGDVHFEDPAEEWIAMHDCILEQQAMEAPFIAIYELEGIDGFPRFADLGIDGEVYSRVQLQLVASGFADIPAPVRLNQCESFSEDTNCTTMSGTLCIDCVIDGFEQLCP